MYFSTRWPEFPSVSLPVQWILLIVVFGGYLVATWLLERPNALNPEDQRGAQLSIILRIRAALGFTDWCTISLFFAFTLGLIPPTVEALVPKVQAPIWAVLIQLLIALPVVGAVYLVMWKSGSHKIRAASEFEETPDTRLGHVKQVLSTLNFGDRFVLLLFAIFSMIPLIDALDLVL